MISTTGKWSGLSLIELIVAIGIISSIILLGSLYFKNHFSETILETSAQELASTLLWARRLAITKRKVHKVVFEPKRRRYWIENEDDGKVDRAIYLKKGVMPADPELGKWGEEDGIVEAGVPDNAFLFYPQGTAEGGSIYLKEEGSKKWYTITLVPTTGDVRIYQGKH